MSGGSPTTARHSSLTTKEFVRAILTRMERDDSRPIDFYRIRELCPPLTKQWVLARLKTGELQARRLHGLTLITGDSLRRLLASAKSWRSAR